MTSPKQSEAGDTAENGLYIGLMSGTSLDAVDAVLVDFSAGRGSVSATLDYSIPADIRAQLIACIQHPDQVALDQLGTLDRELGLLYARSVLELLEKSGTDAADVQAIGSHGQTIRHQPYAKLPFTMQIGDAATIAATTGIPTVSDFRSADIALGGQGAPLVPAFHEWRFAAPNCKRAIVNIGGIANVTLLVPGQAVTGFDTGPGNTLLDSWATEHRSAAYDQSGQWAASGAHDQSLLHAMLADRYFQLSPPKSTGREYFNRPWLARFLDGSAGSLNPADIQATLAELTAQTVAAALKDVGPNTEVYVCGGGAQNTDLMKRISAALPGYTIDTTAELGVQPDWVEAVAFAWLARARVIEQPGNLPSVTGATRKAVLGSIHRP